MLFLALFTFVLMLFAGRLFVLQIVDTKGDTDNAQVYSTVTTVRAARGDILDRNGNVLVGNRASYNLVFNHYVIKSYAERNEALYRLVQKCKELGITYSDHFPVTRERPFDYTLTELNTSWQNNFQLFMTDIGLDSDVTAPLLLPKEESIIAIRTIAGNVEILIPYDIGVKLSHTALYGTVRLFDQEKREIRNQQIAYKTEGYEESSSRVKIVTSIGAGSIVVRRI